MAYKTKFNLTEIAQMLSESKSVPIGSIKSFATQIENLKYNETPSYGALQK